MLITEYQNGFDLQHDRAFYSPAPGTTFADWYEIHYRGREYSVALVVLDGEPLARERWRDDLKGEQIHIMLKPGDPMTVFTVINTALAIGSVVYSLVNRPNAPNTPEESPTYSINAQSNEARLGAVVPVQYGRHRIWPDLLSQPFSTYASNDQYLYQLFCVGAGEYDTEDLQIDDTVVENFSEIDYEYYYNTPVTLFPTNVVTASEVGAQELGTDFTGPFIASAGGTQANRLEIDIVWDQGLFRARSEGDTDPATTTLIADYRAIDDLGEPTGSWTTFLNEVITDTTRVPKRLTRAVAVTPGRYEVRLRRGEISQTGPKMFTRCVWESLRAYLEDDAETYEGLTVLAVRARATGNLNQNSSRRFNLVGTRKLPIWDGSQWSAPTATRSIAWALADIIRAEYGAARADDLIDLQKLLALDATWSDRGDMFDYRFDVTTTMWESLKLAARAGRAIPVMNNQVISFMRAAPQSVPATIFNRKNLRDFTVEYQFLNEESPDSVLAEYVAPDLGWQVHQVLCQPPGSAGTNPKRVRYNGIINREQAFREGIYDAEVERKQRKTCKFTTELEGYIPQQGELVAVANEDFRYDQGGEVVEVDGLVLTLSEPLTWTPSVAHAIRLRKADGSVDGPHLALAGPNPNQVELNEALDWTPQTDGTMVRTLYHFGVLGSTLSDFLIKEMRPRGRLEVELVCLGVVDSVHSVDEAEVPPDNTPGPIAGNPDGPVIRTLLVENASNPAILHIAWSPAPGATEYVIERSLDDGDTWSLWTTTTNTQITLPAPTGDLSVRVAGVGRARGPWKYWSGTVGEYDIHSPTGLSLTAELALSTSGDYVTNLVFTFSPEEDDYHIKTFEAQYKLARHADWKPLYNALETRWEWQSAEIGVHQVRVRSVYVQGEVFSDWAEAQITSLGTFDSIAAVGLPDPVDPLLFITTDTEKSTADIRISVGYEGEGAAPDRFLLFYSAAQAPATLQITSDDGNKLYIDPDASIAGTFSLSVVAGSTAKRVRFSNTGIDIDLSGMWWIAIESPGNGNTRFFKIAESSTTEFVLAAADEFPFIPAPGDTIQVVELEYADSRLPEFSLLWVNGEVIRHGGIDFDGQYYVVAQQRGAEGTTQSDQGGQLAHYYPALGPLTNTVEIMASDFQLVDGRFVYSGTIPVSIPSEMVWGSVSCCLARRATESTGTQYVRSNIVQLIQAGPA
ncbi:hypothetical protein PHACT_12510 [Pseudohongiella acticola]|uniref:Tip attachment protein J HDII-ins2 domain-containing protein n=1 Tax=Pseudohongiella acticola TaxID=1524254 RepID=A0A1E8CG36_9GAMM|nr:host specificity factor TipJ family phage tail protein [Pseudohongiella acticola]OFE11373.1 hypothetical protein PHACT_12510 [Pseudohongiella acticola]